MQTAAFGFYSHTPFSVFGETLIIMVQNFMIIGLIWKYNPDIPKSEILMIAGFMFSYATLIFDPFGLGVLKDNHWAFITSCSTFMSK